jgi:uncharacterized membrane protein (UPF0127 family)
LKPEDAPQPVQVLNSTRTCVLAEHIELAGTSSSRRKGLLGRDSLAAKSGLWIVPCQGVHTWMMRFPIDVVYLSRKKKVRKLRREMPPWRISFCLSAHSVLELPAGTIAETGTQVGDQVEINL